MDLQQVVVANIEPAVPHHAFAFVNDAGEVVALIDVIHVEAVGLHVLRQILGIVTVITDLQRIDLELLDQVREPVETVPEVDEVLAGWSEDPALDVCTVWHAIPGFCLVYTLAWQEELRDHVQLPVLLDHDAAGRQVSRP